MRAAAILLSAVCVCGVINKVVVCGEGISTRRTREGEGEEGRGAGEGDNTPATVNPHSEHRFPAPTSGKDVGNQCLEFAVNLAPQNLKQFHLG